jgi:hypothetical protein
MGGRVEGVGTVWGGTGFVRLEVKDPESKLWCRDEVVVAHDESVWGADMCLDRGIRVLEDVQVHIVVCHRLAGRSLEWTPSLTQKDGSLDAVLEIAVYPRSYAGQTRSQPVSMCHADRIADEIVCGSAIPDRKVRSLCESLLG